MYYDTHPDILRQAVADRHEALRQAAHLARLRREVRVRRAERRRQQRADRAREHRPHLVAPPPALAE